MRPATPGNCADQEGKGQEGSHLSGGTSRGVAVAVFYLG
jgi:hypothetical protein